jgi:hypothetical protein
MSIDTEFPIRRPPHQRTEIPLLEVYPSEYDGYCGCLIAEMLADYN